MLLWFGKVKLIQQSSLVSCNFHVQELRRDFFRNRSRNSFAFYFLFLVVGTVVGFLNEKVADKSRFIFVTAQQSSKQCTRRPDHHIDQPTLVSFIHLLSSFIYGVKVTDTKSILVRRTRFENDMDWSRTGLQ